MFENDNLKGAENINEVTLKEGEQANRVKEGKTGTDNGTKNPENKKPDDK